MGARPPLPPPLPPSRQVGEFNTDPGQIAKIVAHWFGEGAPELAAMAARAKALGRSQATFDIVRDLAVRFERPITVGAATCCNACPIKGAEMGAFLLRPLRPRPASLRAAPDSKGLTDRAAAAGTGGGSLGWHLRRRFAGSSLRTPEGGRVRGRAPHGALLRRESQRAGAWGAE